MITAHATECMNNPPWYNNAALAPSTDTHNTPTNTASAPITTPVRGPSTSTIRRAQSRTGGVAANAPTNNDAARVSVPMYTRVGSPPSNNTSIASNDTATNPTDTITNVRTGCFDHFQIATSTTGHSK